MQRFSESLSVDLGMAFEDLAGSRAHAQMLGEVGLITAEERAQLLSGLDQVECELRAGTFRPGMELEDIHMAVESRLTELTGEVGGKLHTARSRNDQVATDVRLWLRTRLQHLDLALVALLQALLARVRTEGRTLMPGYTHLQRGQPIWLGHHLLAHAWSVSRDRERLAEVVRRVNRSPLGACALAGTPHPIDRNRTAQLLGFDGVVYNAMDAVAARDHLLEAVSVCAIAMTGLSRLAEELVLWSSSEFAFVRLAEAHATGSSIMPQKRNPDAAELVRGKSARVIGHLQALLVLVKGLPLAYNRDLQEDRQALFDALTTTVDCVYMTASLIEGLQVHRERFVESLRGDLSLATEIADFLVVRGVPFREAHHVAGRLVRWCEHQGVGLNAIPLEVLKAHHAQLGPEVLQYLDPEGAAERRTSLGGTAWCEVLAQVQFLETTLPLAVLPPNAPPTSSPDTVPPEIPRFS